MLAKEEKRFQFHALTRSGEQMLEGKRRKEKKTTKKRLLGRVREQMLGGARTKANSNF